MITGANVVHELPLGPYHGSSVFEWTVNKVRVRLTLADLDRLGCLLEKAEVRPATGVHLNIDPEYLGQRFGYLGEMLAIIEQERGEGRAVLRSSPPSVDNAHTYFFELVLDREEGLSLARHAYDHVRRERKMIAAPMTTDALGRLIDDLKRLAADS